MPPDDVASSTQAKSKRPSKRAKKLIRVVSAMPRSDGSRAANERVSAVEDNLKKDAGSVSAMILAAVVAMLSAVRDCATGYLDGSVLLL